MSDTNKMLNDINKKGEIAHQEYLKEQQEKENRKELAIIILVFIAFMSLMFNAMLIARYF